MKSDSEGLLSLAIRKGLRLFLSKRVTDKDLEQRIMNSIKIMKMKLNRCLMAM